MNINEIYIFGPFLFFNYMTLLFFIFRWDAQRMRERFHHDHLLKRYMMKEGVGSPQDKKKEKIASFLPKIDECTLYQPLEC